MDWRLISKIGISEEIVKEKRKNMKFSGRKQSKNGVVALFLAIFSIVGFIALCVWSVYLEGMAPILIGSIALTLAFFSFMAFVFAIQGLKEKEVYYGIPVVGVLLSGIQFVLFFCVYMIGLV